MRGERLLMAQALSAHIATRGNCTGKASVINHHEQALDGKGTPSIAVRAQAEAAIQRMCAGCPVIALCRRWVEAERYTGLAAGDHWHHGERQPLLTAAMRRKVG